MINALPDKPYPYVPVAQLELDKDKQAVFGLAPIKSLEFVEFMKEMATEDDPLLDIELAKSLNELEPDFREQVIAQLRVKRAEKIALTVLGEEGLGWLRRCLKWWKNFVYDGKDIQFIPIEEGKLCSMSNIDRIPAPLRSELTHAIMKLNRLEEPEAKKSE